MKNENIQSLVTIQAIKDFLLLEFSSESESKKKCVVAIVKEIKTSQGEVLDLAKLDNVIFDNKFVPFIEKMSYDLELKFKPVKSVFYSLTERVEQ